MNFNNQDRQPKPQRPCCRDKGRMWGRAGALCLSSLPEETPGFGQVNGSPTSQDKHKAPTTSSPNPLSLQNVPTQAALSLPVLVVKFHYYPTLRKKDKVDVCYGVSRIE